MILEKEYSEVYNINSELQKNVLKKKKYSKFMLDYLQDVYNKLSPIIDKYKTKDLADTAKYIYNDRYYISYSDGEKDTSPKDVWRRVARSIVSADTFYTDDITLLHLEEKLIYDLLEAKLFLPNSPTIFNVGKNISKKMFDVNVDDMTYDDYTFIANNQNTKNTTAACFVLGVDDNLMSIMATLKNIALISSAGGGIGLNFSTLRPEYSAISSGGYSSGAISFLRTYNELGENILEGGIRRFAGMAVIGFANLSDENFWDEPVSLYPDIFDFINAKHNNTGTSTIRNFNISIGINNSLDFLNKINNNEDIPLEFEHHKLSELLSYDFNTKIYDKLNPERKKEIDIKLSGKINARKIFDDIIDNSWKTGDPGFVFLDKANKYNPLRKYITITSTNPCGERPNLSSLKYDMITPCNLASIDVSKFVENSSFDFELLSLVSELVLHVLDLLIDLMMFPLDSIKKSVLLLRDAGLGFMGLHGAMIQQNIEYDSKLGQDFAYYIMKTIEVGGTHMSYLLAKNKYPFITHEILDNDIPRAEIWDAKYVENSQVQNEYIESIYNELKNDTKLNTHLRNFSITSVAPTGTLSQLIQIDEIGDIGSGIEPLFALKYDRFMLNKDGESKTKVTYFTKLLELIVKNKDELDQVKKYIDKNFTIIGVEKVIKDISFNPNIFKTALDINYMSHLKMLESVQKACSSSVSKTINMTKSATKKDVESAFRFAIESPIVKGVTIYRDGSLDTQVLSTGEKKEKKEDSLFKLTFDTKGKILPKERPMVMETLKQLVSIKNGKEITFYVELGLDTNNDPFEVFIRSTVSSKDHTELFNAIGRLASLAFRSNISPDEALKQIKKIKTWGNDYDAISGTIADTINNLIQISKNKGKKRIQNIDELNTIRQNWKLVSEGYYVDNENKLRCPICGSELVKQEGCITCNSCGWSACS